MFQYRQVLLRLRQGDSDRDIARSGLMGRTKVAGFSAAGRCPRVAEAGSSATR